MPKQVSKQSAQKSSLFISRTKTLQKRLKGEQVQADAVLLTNPKDIRYLTGFIGDDSWAIVPMRGSVITILSDSRFEEQIQREAPHAKAVMRTKSLSDSLKETLLKRKLTKVLLQPDYTTLAIRKAIANKIGAKNILEHDDGLLQQRAIKTPDEIKQIQKALVIQQCAFNQTIAEIKPGMTEYEITAILEYKMRALGADGTSFPSIVAADANASLPHAIPGKTKVKTGGIVLIDWGARYNGYCSDLTRVIALGKMKPRIREIYQITLDAQEAAIAAIKPGARLCDIDAVARNIITKAGYGKEFSHSLGHGLGLDIHEEPRLAASVKGELQEGQVVTVEPGIYLPGIGGVRIEDDVLVTSNGYKVLSDLPKTLESAII
ncbi:putative peptidase [Poriferisphaera corsica]|uniref:Putative peptidase n=1 Tax=Poriferisphaera corsica TaxID=2528020 RepID=A0A517YVF8_9BACT|nr:aminopeptidase P family protein [Poriferisphaera corsica]QDU34223.1 putative peptidase [Poriferisphaera corsica]